MLQSKRFLAGLLTKHCGVNPTSVPLPSPFFGQYYLGRRHARTCHCAAVMQNIMFPVGTKLHRSKHEHVLTSLSFLHLSYLFNLPLCVLIICFSFFSSLRKGKACHSLTDYVITVKFMLFCNLETSYSMAHLIKHLRRKKKKPSLL